MACESPESRNGVDLVPCLTLHLVIEGPGQILAGWMDGQVDLLKGNETFYTLDLET